LFKGGGFRLLGVQCLTVISVSLWSGITTWMLLAAIDKIIPIRMCIEEEILGADIWIHDIKHDNYDFDSIINEMIAEGLDLNDHIKKSTSNRTAIHFNLFIVDKFLFEKKNNHWWKRLTNQNSIENYDRGLKNHKRRINNGTLTRAAWIDVPPETKTIRY